MSNLSPEKILALMLQYPTRNLHFSFIFRSLKLDRREKSALKKMLERLVREDKIESGRGKHYRLRREAPPGERGSVCLTPSGVGFVRPEKAGPDLYIPERFLDGLGGGDIVEFSRGQTRGGRNFAKILRLVERRQKSLVGILTRHKGSYFLEKTEPAVRGLIRVDRPPKEIPLGDLVAIQLREQPGQDREMLVGEVIETLGKPGSLQAEIRRIIYRHALPTEFSAELRQQAVARKDPGLSKSRIDLRQLPFVTIDGDDAKDFDDAVALTWTDGQPVVWVAIADVSYYVRPDSALDVEARERGTSVYFPDFVLPMLPPELSEESCSLKPNVDRPALVAEIQLDEERLTVNFRLHEALIRSQARLTYKQVGAFLQDSTPLPAGDSKMVRDMNRIAETLRARRFREGSLELAIPEPAFRLDPEREHVESVEVRITTTSTSLIEELMLLANREVAGFMIGRELPGLYRVHQQADEKKLAAIVQLLERLGLGPVRLQEHRDPVNQLIAHIGDHPMQGFLHKQVLCCLPQATYSTENQGHYGLGFDEYLHFTSPIRRYPDLFVHQQLKRYLHKQGPEPSILTQLPEIARLSSEREQLAKRVSRECDTVYMLSFLERHVGEAFAGTITNVTAFGCFVELDRLPISGLVASRSLIGFVFAPRHEAFRHVESQRLFRVGDAVAVRAVRVNVPRRHLDLEMI